MGITNKPNNENSKRNRRRRREKDAEAEEELEAPSRTRSRSRSSEHVFSLHEIDGNPRSSRELFVGNTPSSSGVDEKTLQQFLNDSLRKVGLVNATETPIIHCRISNKSKFSFIEFC